MEVSDDLPEVVLSEEHAQWFEEALSNASDEELEAAISQMSEQELATFMATVVKYGKKYGPKIVTLMKKYGPALWKKFGPKIIDGFKKLGSKIKRGFKKVGTKIKKGWKKVFGGKRRRKFRRALDSDSEEFQLSEEEEDVAWRMEVSDDLPEVELSEEHAQWFEEALSNASDEELEAAISQISEQELATFMATVVKYGKKYGPKIVTLMKKYGPALWKKFGPKIIDGFKKLGSKIKRGFKKKLPPKKKFQQKEIESAIANAQNEEEVKAFWSKAKAAAKKALPYIIKYGKKYWPIIKKCLEQQKETPEQCLKGIQESSEEEIESAIANTQNEKEVKDRYPEIFISRSKREFRRRRRVFSFRRALAESEDSEEFEVAEPEVELSEEEQQLADFLNNASEEEIESMIANAKDEQEVRAIFTLAATAATTALPFIIKAGKKYWPQIKKGFKKLGSKIKSGFKKVGTKIKKGWKKVFGGKRRRKFRRALDSDSEEFELASEEELAGVLSQLSEEEIAEIKDMSEEELADWFFSVSKAWKGMKKKLAKAGKWTKGAWKTIKKKVGRL